MKSIAIITARGGSKRIPKKNVKDFCEKPIIGYSIEAALKSNLFNEVMVSTDSKEIAEISINYGAKVPFFRSEETSNDYSTTSDVLLEVLEAYRCQNQEFDLMCCIYPTAPFVTSRKLIDAYKKLKESKADSIIPVVSFSFPPQRAFYICNNQLKYCYPENANTRSQDLEVYYHDCGQFYMCRVQSFLKYHSLVMPNSIPFILPENEVQDIDNMMDWKLAELKYRMLSDERE